MLLRRWMRSHNTCIDVASTEPSILRDYDCCWPVAARLKKSPVLPKADGLSCPLAHQVSLAVAVHPLEQYCRPPGRRPCTASDRVEGSVFRHRSVAARSCPLPSFHQHNHQEHRQPATTHCRPERQRSIHQHLSSNIKCIHINSAISVTVTSISAIAQKGRNVCWSRRGSAN